MIEQAGRKVGMMGEFDGKVALVTGGASGIGRASVQAFARAGAHVVVADIDSAGAMETVRIVEEDGGLASFKETELTNPSAVGTLVRNIIETHGRLDFAHNNAGISDAPFVLSEISDERWDRMIAINLSAVFYCMREELPVMAKQGGGAIVNTSSGAGVFGSAHIAHYAAAKHGVIGLTRGAAIEYADAGIRVNAVCPGLTDTPMRKRSLESATPKELEHQQRILDFSGGRVNPPELVADTALWLCREESAGVTGQSLLADGKYGPENRLGSWQHWAPLEQLVRK